MEVSIKVVVIFMLVLIIGLVLAVLIAQFSQQSGNLMDQLFRFFGTIIPS